jgi:predicted enzyme related to lactoylglutathione lyase
MSTTTTQLIQHTDFASVPTRDVEAAVQFYGTTLGLPVSVYIKDRGYAEVETGNLTLGIFAPEAMGMEFHANPNPLALRVDDVAEARRTLEERGVTFRGDVLDTSVCHMGFFTDPDGNALMLHHRYAPRG